MWDIFPIKLSLCISNPKSYVPTFFILNLLISNQINGPNKLSSCMPTHKEYDHSLSSHLLKSIKVFSLSLLGSRIGLAKKKRTRKSPTRSGQGIPCFQGWRSNRGQFSGTSPEMRRVSSSQP